ncbi:MAG: acyl-ACP--UDP-N-acetylglucosamine O-acyltransferase [Ignavibacteriae bacterium]|nr:MAG: acyl-ACP--UDP-N-acetylglucosamine O-acyltransferase [Ignavibacteriota bacterium]
MGVQIHSSALVGKKAQLGENVVVGPSAILGDDVVVGDGSTISPFAVIQDGARLGKECRIASFSVIGGPPQDLKYKGEPTVLELGDRCDVREYVTLNRGTIETGKTVIGSDCLIMANAHIGHDCVVGHHCILANSVALAGHVTLDNWVIIGGLTPVHQFVRIGDHTMVGGGYRVPKDIPPYIRSGREPMVFEGLNSVGLRRRGFTRESIDLIDRAYMLIYQSNLNVSQAVARIKEELDLTPEIQNILEFIANSKRGILPGPGHH